MMRQCHFFLYASSLLLVYEGADESERMPTVDVRMIDFAHAVRSHGRRDDGFLKGVNYLIHVLTMVLLNDRKGCSRLPGRVRSAEGGGVRGGTQREGNGSDESHPAPCDNKATDRDEATAQEDRQHALQFADIDEGRSKSRRKG